MAYPSVHKLTVVHISAHSPSIGEQQLAAAAQARGIPLQTLQTLAQLGVPIAGLGNSFANTGATSGTTSGTQTGTQIGNTTGSSTQTTSTPFNPLSLLPLAFLPMTGGASLGGGILGSLGGGLFGALSNGFMGPGSFNRG